MGPVCISWTPARTEILVCFSRRYQSGLQIQASTTMDALLGAAVPFVLVIALRAQSWLTRLPTAIVAGVARIERGPMSAAPDLERLARDYAAAGDWPGVAQVRDQQAKAAVQEGDLRQAASRLREALSLFVMVDDG